MLVRCTRRGHLRHVDDRIRGDLGWSRWCMCSSLALLEADSGICVSELAEEHDEALVAAYRLGGWRAAVLLDEARKLP